MDLDLILRLGLAVLALVGAPLAFGRVPPNGLYGVRTRRTLASKEAWYAVNRAAGAALFLGALAAMLWVTFAPEHLQVGLLRPSALPLLVVAGAAATSWFVLRRVE